MVFKRRLKPIASVELIPMIDVIFQLVVFFMVSSTFVITPGIDLHLPDSVTAKPVVMSKIIITIVSPEEIYLNKKKESLASLGENLKKIGAQDSKKAKRSVIVQGDKSISYSLMVHVLDILRENGFTGINLRMKQL